MKTRNQRKQVLEIIEIQSEQQSVQKYKSDDSSCSEPSHSDDSQNSASNSQPFMNLVPTNQEKRKKAFLNLKQYLYSQKTDAGLSDEPIIQRAPILNLLRPFSECQQKQQKADQGPQQPQSISEPILGQSDQQQIKSMSQPRKKPKLMEQIQNQLNKPTNQYVVSGEGKMIREQRRKEIRKVDHMLQKRLKQYREGKKKDTVSNQVFNAIEDFFN